VRLWKVVVLLDLALLVGLGGGYLWWAREVRALRLQVAQTSRPSTGASSAAQAWTVRGIVRVVLPSQGAIFLTHESVPGLMAGMTMGFEVEDPKLLDGLQPGDAVRFTLRQIGERLRITAIEKT
jgi:Cu/Ag efflux protein CusF